MKTKKILGLFLLSSTLLMSTGCFRIYEDLTVNPDGTLLRQLKPVSARNT